MFHSFVEKKERPLICLFDLKEAVNQSLRMGINQMSGVAADGGWTGHKHHTCSLGPITNSSAMGKYRVLA